MPDKAQELRHSGAAWLSGLHVGLVVRWLRVRFLTTTHVVTALGKQNPHFLNPPTCKAAKWLKAVLKIMWTGRRAVMLWNIVDAILLWVSHEEARKTHLSKLMSLARLDLVSEDFILRRLMTESMVLENQEVTQLL
ncbi:hypothetical protein ElyMa_005215800 [Elysia marginata]|uniref:BACK domain-containing protein n=1 Tax=Elysia marginata TaxID=1093978 RepID=A0AAV4JZW6_9GAST|nr:hypothetical protein ElyMa_005215800 [Elysia marginata]